MCFDVQTELVPGCDSAVPPKSGTKPRCMGFAAAKNSELLFSVACCNGKVYSHDTLQSRLMTFMRSEEFFIGPQAKITCR